MKILIMVALLSVFSLAGDLNLNKSFDQAKMESKKTNKPILFVYSSQRCKWCYYLKQEIMLDPTVKKVLEDNFVSIIVDAADNSYPYQLRTQGTPGVWFLDSDGRPLFQPINGAPKKEMFLSALDIVQKEYVKVLQEQKKKAQVKK